MTTSELIIVTTRARNLRYGWTNQPYQPSGDRPLCIEDPTPLVMGGLRTIERERADAILINSGNDWSEALWLGNQRIVTEWPVRVGEILWTLRECGEVEVRVEVE